MVSKRSFNLNNETGRPVAVTFDTYSAQPSSENTINDMHSEQRTDSTIDQVSVYNKVSRSSEVFYEIFICIIYSIGGF